MRLRRPDQDQRDTVVERPISPTSAPTHDLDDATDKDPPRGDALPPGTTAGRYVLLTRLGAGGAGLVYSAYDPELDRKVAIKLLHAVEDKAQGVTDGRARLLREAQAMAKLKHPNVLPIYDVGTLEDAHGSRVFIAMELVESGTLRTWLKQRHSRREILEVMTACGRGLEAAHAAGLVHRDFKPDNVLVGPDGRVFVTDFGLVRAAGPSEPAARDSQPSMLASPLTVADAVMGTPGYMAPEQYEAKEVDQRTDQFSFCVTLCEALCGKRIFAGRSLADAMASTLSDADAVAMRDAKLPSWLVRVLARGLSREREARYPSMEALLAALAADPSRRVRRAIAVVAALAVVGGGAFAVQRLSAQHAELCSGAESQLAGVWDAGARERVRQAFQRAGVARLFDSVAGALDRYATDLTAQHKDACEATRVRGEQPESVLGLRMSCLDTRKKELAALAALLADADRATAFRGVESAAKLTSVRSCGDIAALTARVPPPTDPQVRNSVDELRQRLAEGKVLANAAHYPGARKIIDEVVRAEAPLHYGPLRAEALELLADLQREQDGDMKASKQSLVEAMQAAYAARDDARVASTMTGLAMLNGYWLGEHEEGERWVSFARAAIDRLGGSDELEAERERVEAELRIGEDKGAEAVAAAAPALRLAEKVYGPVSVQAAKFHATLGAAHSTAGNEALAREHYTAQHAILEQLVGPDHPLVAMALNNLGLNAEAEGRLDVAEGYYRDSVSLLEKALGADHPRVAIALSNFGATLAASHKPAEALAAFQRALAINERSFGPDYSDSFDALLGIGKALVALGRSREAVAPIEHALKIATSGEPNLWGAADARFALAEATWANGGDHARAHALAVEARSGMATVASSVARRQLAEIDAWLAQH